MADEWLNLLTVTGSSSTAEVKNKFCCCFYEYFLISQPPKDELGGNLNLSNTVTVDAMLLFFYNPGHNIWFLIMYLFC